MILHHESHRSRHGGRLTQSQEGPHHNELLVAGHVGSQASDDRPEEDADADHVTAIKTIGKITGKGTANSVNNEKH